MEDSDSNETLEFLQEKGDVFVKLSTAERKRLADLEDAIAHVHTETDKYRSRAKEAAIDVMNLHVQTPNPAFQRADGNDVGKQALFITRKVLSGLEAKLNKLMQRKSEVLNSNKQKKLEINHMRQMRIQTEIAHSKYEATLLGIKDNIETLATESAEIVSERERLVQEKNRLEKINEEEQKTFTEQHEAMSRFIKEQNLALEDALIKERKFDKNPSEMLTSDMTNNSSTSSSQLLSTMSSAGLPELTLEEEIDIVRQVSRLTNFVHSEQNSLSSIQGRINGYESMFDQLKHMSSTSNLDEVLVTYAKHEEEMFSIYNYIRTMNKEIDSLNEAKSKVKKDMNEFQVQQCELDDSKRKVVDDLERQLEKITAEAKSVKQQNKTQSNSLLQINKKISNIFFKLQCDQFHKGDSEKVNLLLSHGVNESTVHEFLGCIEQRAVDIISAYVKSTAPGHDASSLQRKSVSLRRFSSPGGLSTPANWGAVKHAVNLESIVDLQQELQVLATSTAEADTSTADTSRLINISQYKERLYSRTNSVQSQSLPMLPAVSGSKSAMLLLKA